MRPFPLTAGLSRLASALMIKNTLLFGAVLATAHLMVSAQEAAAPAPAPNTPASMEDPLKNVPMDKVSYFIGNNFGKRMAGEGFTLDFDEMLAGIKDGAQGKESKFPPAELESAMDVFQNAMTAVKSQREAKNIQVGKDFLSANGKREGVTTTASGLQYEVMKAAEGAKPKATDQVKVHYHGTLLSGKVFDSSVQRGEPIDFGLNQVIPGWTEGVQLMSKGSKYKFFIPSELAYGANGQGEIGPNEVLIFEVELIDFTSM
jgi:FKBP-type peptidyl-prolyl cis-trans isomerase